MPAIPLELPKSTRHICLLCPTCNLHRYNAMRAVWARSKGCLAHHINREDMGHQPITPGPVRKLMEADRLAIFTYFIERSRMRIHLGHRRVSTHAPAPVRVRFRVRVRVRVRREHTRFIVRPRLDDTCVLANALKSRWRVVFVGSLPSNMAR